MLCSLAIIEVVFFCVGLVTGSTFEGQSLLLSLIFIDIILIYSHLSSIVEEVSLTLLVFSLSLLLLLHLPELLHLNLLVPFIHVYLFLFVFLFEVIQVVLDFIIPLLVGRDQLGLRVDMVNYFPRSGNR